MKKILSFIFIFIFIFSIVHAQDGVSYDSAKGWIVVDIREKIWSDFFNMGAIVAPTNDVGSSITTTNEFYGLAGNARVPANFETRVFSCTASPDASGRCPSTVSACGANTAGSPYLSAQRALTSNQVTTLESGGYLVASSTISISQAGCYWLSSRIIDTMGVTYSVESLPKSFAVMQVTILGCDDPYCDSVDYDSITGGQTQTTCCYTYEGASCTRRSTCPTSVTCNAGYHISGTTCVADSGSPQPTPTPTPTNNQSGTDNKVCCKFLGGLGGLSTQNACDSNVFGIPTSTKLHDGSCICSELTDTTSCIAQSECEWNNGNCAVKAGAGNQTVITDCVAENNVFYTNGKFFSNVGYVADVFSTISSGSISVSDLTSFDSINPSFSSKYEFTKDVCCVGLDAKFESTETLSSQTFIALGIWRTDIKSVAYDIYQCETKAETTEQCPAFISNIGGVIGNKSCGNGWVVAGVGIIIIVMLLTLFKK